MNITDELYKYMFHSHCKTTPFAGFQRFPLPSYFDEQYFYLIDSPQHLSNKQQLLRLKQKINYNFNKLIDVKSTNLNLNVYFQNIFSTFYTQFHRSSSEEWFFFGYRCPDGTQATICWCNLVTIENWNCWFVVSKPISHNICLHSLFFRG